MRVGSGRCRVDRGLAATELALLLPAVLLIAVVAAMFGEARQHAARASSAADAGARAAAMHGGESDEAFADALAAAERICRGPIEGLRVVWEEPDREAPGTAHRPGVLQVELACTESLDTLALLGLGAHRSAHASAVASVEYWRVTE